MSTRSMTPQATGRQQWSAPRLSYRGSVAEILKDGQGKLSITGQDMGEMRCEKPHASQCD